MTNQHLDQLKAVFDYNEGPEVKLSNEYTIRFVPSDEDNSGYAIEFNGEVTRTKTIAQAYEALKEGIRLSGYAEEYEDVADECVAHCCPQEWYDEHEGNY